jgi:hypothetical protein
MQNTATWDSNNYYDNYEDLDILEKYVLNKKYVKDSNLARLQRLEMQTFGAIQHGDYNTRYQNVRSAILARPQNNYKKTPIKSFGDYFLGQLTGFTPQINQFPQVHTYNNIYPYNPNPYTNPYERQQQMNYSTPFGSGYRINNYSSGSGTSVRILD